MLKRHMELQKIIMNKLITLINQIKVTAFIILESKLNIENFEKWK